MGEPSTRVPHVDTRERPEHYELTIQVQLDETEEACEAEVRLRAPRGTFTATGESHRHPDDPVVPLIGEELAIGRALVALGEQMQRAAQAAIEDGESRPIHLIDVS